MTIRIILSSCLFLLLNSIFAQTKISPLINTLNSEEEKCGTDAMHKILYDTDSVYRQNFEDAQRKVRQQIANNSTPEAYRSILTIPIVFHVMHLGEPIGTGTNISNEQLLSALASLNDAYRGLAPFNSSGVDMEIEFCLASQDPAGNATTGINRIDASGTSDYNTNGLTRTGTNNHVTIKALSKWPNTDYYNIWVVTEIDGNNGEGGTQGFAYFPGAGPSLDGTVILYNAIGYDPTGSRCFNVKSYTNYNTTLIHELGHALDLYHTFEDDSDGNACPPNTSCTTQGDECCDTPPHERTTGCPSGTLNLCGTLRDNHMHNFMDYSSAACQTEFTSDQKVRARAALTTTRASLLTSSGCTPVSSPTSDFIIECAGPSIARCTGNAVTLYDLSSNNPNSWSWNFSGGNPSTSTSQNPVVSYSNPGIYPVTLIASNNFGTGTTETKSSYITIYGTPTTACINGITNVGNFGHAITNVSFNNIHNTTSNSTNGYDDFSCAATTCITEGQTYNLSIDVQANHPSQGAAYKVFIDYNDNGDFLDLGEQIMSGTLAANSGTVTEHQNITIPLTATENKLLRMRIIHDQLSVTNSCETLFTGSSEDYGVYISPTANINSQPANININDGGMATFTVAATSGISYQWQENSGSGFTDLFNGGIYSNVNTSSLLLNNVPISMNGNTYRCIVSNGCDQTVNSSSAILTVTSPISISYINNENIFDLNVYPNPCENDITLEFYSTTNEIASYKISNLLGQILLKKQIKSISGRNSLKLNMDDLPKGIYLIHLNDKTIKMRKN
ncbi:MAG: T9SS type A sorting domain-containing protein [Saprospiraceae bacterium]|nr:T9SS type A sorting domain-containing protein [Saprospiraceae bacterium]